MTDRICDLDKPAMPNPPAMGNVVHHKPAKRQHVGNAFRAQDRTLTPGRRILLSSGLHGNPRHQVTDIDIAEGDVIFPQPAIDFVNTVAEAQNVPVTPGHILRIEARCIPSGPTGANVGGSLDYQGDYGVIRLAATWDDGTETETVTTDIAFGAQPSDYGHGADIAGMGFVQLTEKFAYNHPTGILFDPGEVVQWTQAGVTVDLTLSYVGGVRPVDVVVYEVPHKIGRTNGVPASPAHIYQTFESPIAGYPLEYPVEGATSGEQRFGAKHGLEVAVASQDQTGPTILDISSHAGGVRNESGAPAPLSITATSLAPLGWTAAVGGGDESPSLDFSGATFGRRFESSSESHALSTTGVCRVRVSAYWKTSGGTATMQFKTAAHSFIELSTTSTSYGWTHAIGHLECGQTVLDAQQIDILGSVTASNTGSVRYVRVEYWPG